MFQPHNGVCLVQYDPCQCLLVLRLSYISRKRRELSARSRIIVTVYICQLAPASTM